MGFEILGPAENTNIHDANGDDEAICLSENETRTRVESAKVDDFFSYCQMEPYIQAVGTPYSWLMVPGKILSHRHHRQGVQKIEPQQAFKINFV
jgi:hypothetical protein